MRYEDSAIVQGNAVAADGEAIRQHPIRAHPAARRAQPGRPGSGIRPARGSRSGHPPRCRRGSRSRPCCARESIQAALLPRWVLRHRQPQPRKPGDDEVGLGGESSPTAPPGGTFSRRCAAIARMPAGAAGAAHRGRSRYSWARERRSETGGRSPDFLRRVGCRRSAGLAQGDSRMILLNHGQIQESHRTSRIRTALGGVGLI